MKHILWIFLCLVMVFGFTTNGFGACTGLGVFVNMDGSVQLIDPASNAVSPAYLKGQLGAVNALAAAVAVTSDGKTAIVSSFYSSKVYFLDISGGFNVEPVLLGVASVPLRPGDLVISPDDKYVLVSNSYFVIASDRMPPNLFSVGMANRIAVLDIAARSFVMVRELPQEPFVRMADSIAIAPNGQTVVVSDKSSCSLYTLTLDENGWLTYSDTLRTGGLQVINMAFSPDGKTLIAAVSNRPFVVVCRLDDAGNLHYMDKVRIPANGGQSVVFSADGAKAYVNCNKFSAPVFAFDNQADNSENYPFDLYNVYILDVTGPGAVAYSGTSITIPAYVPSRQFTGVNTMAIEPNGMYLYVTNPVEIIAQPGVHVIDLSSNSYVETLDTDQYPFGIAFTCQSGAEDSKK